jgi:hypothetical protein
VTDYGVRLTVRVGILSLLACAPFRVVLLSTVSSLRGGRFYRPFQGFSALRYVSTTILKSERPRIANMSDKEGVMNCGVVRNPCTLTVAAFEAQATVLYHREAERDRKIAASLHLRLYEARLETSVMYHAPRTMSSSAKTSRTSQK